MGLEQRIYNVVLVKLREEIMGIFGEDKTIDELEEEDAVQTIRASISDKKKIIREAKRKYGSDWKVQLIKFAKNTKSGMDWNALKFRA